MNQNPSSQWDHPNKSRSRFTWQTLLKFVVPPIITVGLCWILFTGVNLKEMWTIMTTQCNFFYIALALLISILSHVIRGMRWQLQLKALGIHPPLFITILSIFGMYAVNFVFPRLGEIWRTGYIAERQKASFTEVFGSMICDRLADIIIMVFIITATFFLARTQIVEYLSQDTPMYEQLIAILSSPWMWLVALLILIGVAVFFRLFPRSKPVMIAKNLLKGVWEGFIVIVRMKGKLKWAILSILIWTAYYFELYLGFLAFPVTAEVVTKFGFTAVLLCFVLSSIAMAVPSNGGIGPYQWALVFGLNMYSLEIPALTINYTTSFANTILGSNTLMLIVIGIFTFIYIAIDKRRKPIKT